MGRRKGWGGERSDDRTGLAKHMTQAVGWSSVYAHAYDADAKRWQTHLALLISGGYSSL